MNEFNEWGKCVCVCVCVCVNHHLTAPPMTARDVRIHSYVIVVP